MNIDDLDAALNAATEGSIAAEEKEVKIALKLMCLRAKIVFPGAEFIVLDDSDQGEWATVMDVQDAEGDGLTEGYWDDGDMYASHLYDSRVDVWKKYLKEDTWGGRRNPSRGILVIEKVLEDLEVL